MLKPRNRSFRSLPAAWSIRPGCSSERDQAELEAALARFEAATTNQIVVAAVASLEDVPIEDYGYQLGRHWGIGQEGKDNGALLIVAAEEREVRIEVGYGLEGELTDAVSRTIIETQILPRFRQGDYAAGIKAGVAAMIAALGGSYDPALPPVALAPEEPAPSPIPLAIALPIIALIVLNRLFGRRRRRRSRFGYGGPVILPGGWHGGRRRSRRLRRWRGLPRRGRGLRRRRRVGALVTWRS